ncbi:MAG TPA: hypothetical protein VFS43_23935 [Polyangiaceae bacterium]|nr:hypothetical protein [Polyangiaceae bacterium]
MAKRSRRERLESQLDRAVASDGLEAVEALIERSPELASKSCLRLLEGPPPAPGERHRLDALAARLAGTLRQAGRCEQALRVARAGGRRTPRLCLEEALAAFALGDDATSAAAARDGGGKVEAVLAPLLRAAAREPVGDEPPAGLSAAARDLFRVAASCARLRGGGGERATGQASAGGLLGPELSAALELSRPPPERGRRALEALSASPALRASPPARRAVAAAALGYDLGTAEELVRLLALDRDSAHELRQREGARRLQGLAGMSGAALAERLAREDVSPFAESERGAAYLYRGFGLLGSNPAQAEAAYDRAIEFGADLGEALRGKMLAQRKRLGAKGPPTPRELAALGEAAFRLHRALARTPGAEAFAGAAAIAAAEPWVQAGDRRRAAEALGAARSIAQRFAASAVATQLDLLEAELWRHEPARALSLVEAALARSPRHLGAWQRKVELLEALGDDERLDAALAEGAGATGDPGLARRSRASRRRRGALAPFEGLRPGVVTAGELADEAWQTELSPDLGDPTAWLPPAAWACRGALAAEARLAFDVATLVMVAARAPGADACDRFLERLLSAWRGQPEALGRIATVGLRLGALDGYTTAVTRLAADAEAPAAEALVALGEAAIAVHDDGLVDRVVRRKAVSKRLGPAGVKRLKQLAGQVRARGCAEGFARRHAEDVLDEVDRVLSPAFSTARLQPLLEDDDGDEGGSPAQVVLEMMGLPPARVESLPVELQDLFAERALRILSRPPGPAAIAELRALLLDIGFRPDDVERALRGGPGAPKRAKGRAK